MTLAVSMLAAGCATPDRVNEGRSVPKSMRAAADATSDAARSAARATSRVTSSMVASADKRLVATRQSFETPEDGLVADPFEPINRVVYRFNDGLDRVLLGPTASLYHAAIPAVGRHRVRDFIDNWKSPIWFFNDVLQGDFEHAGVTASRFALNTTVGVLGIYDFAAHHADLPKRDEDFGQTLGVYGAGHGPYLMLPLLGPSSFRDLTGTLVDIALDPFTWTEFEGDTAYRATTRIVDIVDIREQSDPAVRAVRDSVDPYTQARALYIQNRTRRVTNGDGAYEELPDFD